MLVKRFSGEVYKKFIEYAVSKSDSFYLTMELIMPINSEYNSIMNVILEDKKFTKKQILYNYSDELFNKIYDEYKDNKKIIDIYMKALDEHYEIELQDIHNTYKNTNKNELKNLVEMLNDSRKYNKKIFENKNEKNYRVYNDKRRYFLNIIEWFKYNAKCEIILKKYKNNIINIKSNLFDLNNSVRSRLIKTIKFRINEETTQLLYKSNSIYTDWFFPDNFEDLCFSKDNVIWFDSVTHEEIYDIYCENEEEYEYLKSMGIKFYQDHYIKEKTYIYDENDEEIGFKYDRKLYFYTKTENGEILEIKKQ